MTKLILAITPDSKLQDQISAHLQEGGRFQVFCASTGKEAITIAAKEPFDLAILDADTSDLPFLPLTRELIGLQPSMKLLIFPPQNNPRHPLMNGVIANGFLNKPFFGPEVNGKLIQLLNITSPISNHASNDNDLTRLWVNHPESGQKLVEQLLASTSASGGILLIHRQVASVAGAIGDNTSQNIINFLTRYWTNIQTGELFRYLKMDSETKTYLVYATPLMKDVAFALIYHTNQSLIEIRSEVSHIRKAFLNRFADTRDLRAEFVNISAAPDETSGSKTSASPAEPKVPTQNPRPEAGPSLVEEAGVLHIVESQAQAAQNPEETVQNPEEAVQSAEEPQAIPASEPLELKETVISPQQEVDADNSIPSPVEESIAPAPKESLAADPSNAENSENISTAETESKIIDEELPSLSKNEFENLEELSAEASSQESEQDQDGLSPDDLEKLDKLLAQMPSPDPDLEPEPASMTEEEPKVEPPPLPIVEPITEPEAEPVSEVAQPSESENTPIFGNEPGWQPINTGENELATEENAVQPPPLPNVEPITEPEVEPVSEVNEPSESENAPVFGNEPGWQPISTGENELSAEENAVQPPPLPNVEPITEPEAESVSEVNEPSESENAPVFGNEPGWQPISTEENELATEENAVQPPQLPIVEPGTAPEVKPVPEIEQPSESDNTVIPGEESGWQPISTEENILSGADHEVQIPPLPQNEESSSLPAEELPNSAEKTVPSSPLSEQTVPSASAGTFPNFDFKLPWEEGGSEDLPIDAEPYSGFIPAEAPSSDWMPLAEPVNYADLSFEFQFLLIPRNPQQLITHDIANLIKLQLPRLHESNNWKCVRISTRPLYLQWSALLPVDTYVADMVQEIKERTNILIFANFPALLKDHLDGEFWMPGYFAVSGSQLLSNHFINDTISLIRQIQPAQIRE
jgi:CheY-like chemotaxis protein